MFLTFDTRQNRHVSKIFLRVRHPKMSENSGEEKIDFL
jgi:hypothetical protein